MFERIAKNKILRWIIICAASFGAFFLLTMPFREILSVFTVSEVRPAAVLNSFLGISFGMPAAVGITIANTLADAVSGYPLAVVLEGIIPQFLYTMIPYLMWRRLTRGEGHKHRLNTVSRVLKYTAVILVYAAVSGIGVATIVYANFGSDFLSCAFFVFLNNFDMSMILGCPLMILFNILVPKITCSSNRKLSANEKIILLTVAIQAVVSVILAAVVISGTADTSVYGIWNTLYIYVAIAINIIMVASFPVMVAVEKKHGIKT